MSRASPTLVLHLYYIPQYVFHSLSSFLVSTWTYDVKSYTRMIPSWSLERLWSYQTPSYISQDSFSFLIKFHSFHRKHWPEVQYILKYGEIYVSVFCRIE